MLLLHSYIAACSTPLDTRVRSQLIVIWAAAFQTVHTLQIVHTLEAVRLHKLEQKQLG